MYKIQRSDYAYGCTSLKYCYQERLEDALRVFENYKKHIYLIECPNHKYTATITADDEVLIRLFIHEVTPDEMLPEKTPIEE